MQRMMVGLVALATAGSAAPLTVAVEGGRIAGAAADGVQAWKGVPFAAPPVGANRWRAPQPVKRWTGVRPATAYGHDCMQQPFPSDAAPLGTAPAEDCLVANVWRPDSAATRLPVMVWIYGGGYVNGGSSPSVYDGSAFARAGIVFVSFNYRLGRFGFFAHPALTAAHEGGLGNYGLMDQLAALKWVRANIARFGGDPSQVTVFGESAGGGSVMTMLTSPAAKGLFQRAMVMSGGGRGSLMAAATIPQAEAVGVAFAQTVGVTGTDAAALAALRALPAEQVTQGLNMATMAPRPGQPRTYVGGPVADGTIVTATPQQVLDAHGQAGVPVMIGSNGADIGFGMAADKDALFASFGAGAAAARTAYDPDGSADLRSLVSTVAMDRMMTEPARFVARSVARDGQPAWVYRFAYVAQSMRPEWRAAPHATDIPYFFDTVAAKYGDKLAPADVAMAKAANAYLVNFAKTGDPNGSGLPRWDRAAPAATGVMQFPVDGAIAFGPDPWTPRLDAVAAAAR